MNISVIIPVLNELAVVAEAIERAWRAGADEVIVSDGGSTDGTAEIAARLRCRVVQGAAGRAVQQNRGAGLASGDVLLFLHVDNWLEPGSLDQVRRAMQLGRHHGGAFRQAIEAEGRLYRLLERGNAARVRLLGLAYGDQGIFVTRDTFEELGRFPELPFMEDLCFMRKLRRRLRPLLLAGPLHVSARRWQKNGVIRQTLRNWSLLTAEKCGISPDRLARFYPPA